MTDIVEQAAKVACPNGPDHDHQPNLDQGCNWALQLCQALADAGLLAEPARLAAVEKLHPLVKVYDECDHENCTAEPVEVYDYTACTDSLIGYACRACCFQNSEYMVEACPHDLDHADTTETTYCPTIKALKGETND